MTFSVTTARGEESAHFYRASPQEARADLRLVLLDRKRNDILILLAMFHIWPIWTIRLHHAWQKRSGRKGWGLSIEDLFYRDRL